MPHIIVEYTENIAPEARIASLLEKMHGLVMEYREVFPIGGLRSRAYMLNQYRVADGAEDDAFVHVLIKIGAGREPELLKSVFDRLFDLVKDHYADLYAKRYLAISMEINEFSEAGTYKHNNIHARFKAGTGNANNKGTL